MKKEKLNKINVGIDDSTVYAESLKSNVGAGDSARPQKRNTQKGITLVALVITIIVMLLLSVVSINIMQNAGIIEKVKLAKEEHRASTIQEQKELFEKEIEISKYEGSTPKTINDLLDKLEEEKLIIEEEKNTIIETGRITIGSKKIIFDTIILPEGYTRCEYLESTGTQYIDIGLKVSNKTKVELVGKQYTSASSLFGVNPLFVITSSQSTDRKKQLCRFRYNNTTQDTDVNILELSKITFDKNKGYINDVLLATFTETTFSSTYNAILFGRRINSSGALEELAQQRIDYFKMWENDVLVRDMIPCLDNNGTPCMYDTVSGKTFYNQGTGEFIAGPVVE